MDAKKLLFIYPSSYDERGRVRKQRSAGIPSRALPYLAALTPERYEVRIIDELIDDVRGDEDADLVAFTGLLTNIPRAIDLARGYRERGIRTVIGGPGAYSLRERVVDSDVFDSIVLGEAEGLWEVVLDDLQRKRLQPQYESECAPDLSGLPHARYDLLKLSRYMRAPVDRESPMIPIETGRGCPHNCRYCLVSRYFGRKMRYRPVGEVVEELRYHRAKHIVFTDDNMGMNTARATELFTAIKPLGIQWFGQFETRVAKDPELLRLAAESGCRTAFVGMESLDPVNLDSVDKSQNVKTDLGEVATAFREAGIIVMASLIFGLDNDTPEKVEWTVEQLIRHGIDTMIPWLLTPIPRTPVYDDCKREERLLHEDYSLYDGAHVVIRPKRMTPDELRDAFWAGLRRFYSLGPIVRRVIRAKKGRVAELMYNANVYRNVRRGLHPILFGASPGEQAKARQQRAVESCG